VWQEFKKFIARGNVIDLAIGVIIGAAFGRIVTSLVEGIIMPPIGLLLGKVDFASMFVVLDHAKGEPASLADAKAKGIPVFAYGQFINDIINFLIIALVIFLLIRAVQRIRGVKDESPTKKTCPLCATEIPLAAKRCPNCTSELAA
jgi:large conductance mechanosensitive channel